MKIINSTKYKKYQLKYERKFVQPNEYPTPPI